MDSADRTIGERTTVSGFGWTCRDKGEPPMRAELWRDSHYVGFFVVSAGGKVTEDFVPSERERIVPLVAEVRRKLLKPEAWVGSGSPADVSTREPGDSAWLERVLGELTASGYESRLLEDDGFGRDGAGSH
jgi:hypothetical protein